MLMTLLILAGGLVLLVIGAELLVRGAAHIALLAGLSPLVIGLTIVAFGTSAPELAVSINAGLDNKADIAVGNVVGSNIFNVLVILGLTAVVAPLTVHRKLVRFDVPVMIYASVILWCFAIDGVLSVFEGIFLAALIVIYTLFLVWEGHHENKLVTAEYTDGIGAPDTDTPLSWLKNIGLVLGGLAMLVFGADLLVQSATDIARTVGVSELVIGLTIVAAGTSLPELATSVVAAIRGQRDIAIGNIIGSNIFNILCVLGFSSVVSGGITVAPASLAVDLPVMLGVALSCLPIFLSGYTVYRWQGAAWILCYIVYTTWLILDAQANPFATSFGHYAVAVFIPLVTLLVTLSMLQLLPKHDNPSS